MKADTERVAPQIPIPQTKQSSALLPFSPQNPTIGRPPNAKNRGGHNA
jgi:hypothetical protein